MELTMGERIARRRNELGFKQAELARLIGIRQPSLHAIELGGTKTLKATTLIALCEELRTTADFLLRGSEIGQSLDLATMEAELLFTIRSLDAGRRIALIEFARHLMAQMPDKKPPTSTSQEAVIQPLKTPKKK